jgi:hypothetical protein
MKRAKKTIRRAKTDRVPRTRNGGRWTESQFWEFIRRNLRKASMKWGPRMEAKKRARRPTEFPGRNRKYDYQCCKCLEWFLDSQTQMDHVVPCGPLTCEDHMPGFATRLFCEVDGWQVMCIPCHDGITAKQREERTSGMGEA